MRIQETKLFPESAVTTVGALASLGALGFQYPTIGLALVVGLFILIKGGDIELSKNKRSKNR